MTPLPITEPSGDRSCGECQACCEVLETRPFSTDDGHTVTAGADSPVLTKRFERCMWQCDQGCGIYEHRPSPCAAYHCMWRLGWGEDDARPDRLGVLVEGAPNGWMFVVETRPGGAEEELTQSYMQAAINHPKSPARAIHVTRWGTDRGYWIGGTPERIHEELVAVLAAMTDSSPRKEETDS